MKLRLAAVLRYCRNCGRACWFWPTIAGKFICRGDHSPSMGKEIAEQYYHGCRRETEAKHGAD